MSTRKKIIISVLVVSASVASLVAYSGHGDRFGKFGWSKDAKVEFVMNRISDHLDLNDDQFQNLQNLRSTLEAAKAEHAANKPDALAIALLSEPVLDEYRIVSEIESRVNKVTASVPEVVGALAQFTNSLDEEQRAEMVETIQKLSEKRRRYEDE